MATIEQREKFIKEMERAETALTKTKWDFIIIGAGLFAVLVSWWTRQITPTQFLLAGLAGMVLVIIRSYYAAKQRAEIRRIREAGPGAL